MNADMKTGKARATLRGDRRGISALAFTPDGKTGSSGISGGFFIG